MANKNFMKITINTKIENTELLQPLQCHDIGQHKNPDIIIAGTERYTKNYLNKNKNIKIISRIGSGIDNIDLETADKLNIKILRTPKECANTVAEFTVAQMIYGLRKLHLKTKEIGRDLSECTIGIIGYGEIGSCVWEKLDGWGVKCLINDIKNIPDISSKDEIYQKCDIITFHIPLYDYNINNKNLITRQQLREMKSDVILVNMSRSDIINEKHIYKWLINNPRATFITDVVKNDKSRLKTCDNCIITPHIASYTKNARYKMEQKCIENIINNIGSFA